MRILLLSHYFPPDFPSTGVLMAQLFSRLAQKGWNVTVITGLPVRVGKRKNRQSGARIGWSDYNGMQVLRLPIPVIGDGESLAARMAAYVAYNLLSMVAALLCGRADVVFSPSPPLTNGIVIWLIGRLKGSRTVYNVQDLVPEAYVQFGVLKNRALIRLFEAVEKFVYLRNDVITVISSSFAAHVAARGVRAEKIEVIPNFVDTDEIRTLPRDNDLARRLNVVERFVVMHAGSIAHRHGVEVLVDVARALAHEPGIEFLVVGDGSRRAAVEMKAREAGLPNFRLLPYVDRSELPSLRASADVQMILLRKGMTSHSVPCKVYEIMASGRPFIAAVDEGSTIWDLAGATSCGLAVQPESVDDIAAAILSLYNDSRLAADMGQRARHHAVTEYSLAAVADQYDGLFRRMTSSEQNR